MRDEELIRKVIDGRPGAFDELYYAYVDRVHRHLYTVVGADPDLDDLVQQTFIQVFRNVQSYRADSSFGTWLHRITLNVALAHLRGPGQKRKKDLAELDLELPSPHDGPDDAFGRREKIDMLHALLARLHEKKRVAFLLYEVGGHTLEEISELVSAPVPTVAARVRAARQEMKKALQRQARGSHVATA